LLGHLKRIFEISDSETGLKVEKMEVKAVHHEYFEITLFGVVGLCRLIVQTKQTRRRCVPPAHFDIYVD